MKINSDGVAQWNEVGFFTDKGLCVCNVIRNGVIK